MTTLREKRHRQCLNTIGRLTEQRELAFRRLALIQSRLHDERLRLRRLQKELGKKPIFTPMPEAPAWIDPNADLQAAAAEADPGPLPTLYPDPIPDFLKRDVKDRAARAEIEAHKAEVKATKTKARIDRLKAAQRGDLKRMPVTGRDALKVLKRLREG